MGKGAKAGKRKPAQRESRRMSDEARQISVELEKKFSEKMLPVAVIEAFILLMNISCIVLHDDFGFGKKRLGNWAERVLDTWECVPEYVTMDELSEEVIRMTGCRFALTSDEVERLKEYSLTGLAREVQLNEAAKGYWQARRSEGWESTSNRYGKEVAR